MRKFGRAAEGSGLENRQAETLREFESHNFRHAGIAQTAEQSLCKRKVAGSMPASGTSYGCVAQWQSRVPYKALVDGSSPSASTKTRRVIQLVEIGVLNSPQYWFESSHADQFQRGSGRVVQALAFQASENGSIPLIRSSHLEGGTRTGREGQTPVLSEHPARNNQKRAEIGHSWPTSLLANSLRTSGKRNVYLPRATQVALLRGSSLLPAFLFDPAGMPGMCATPPFQVQNGTFARLCATHADLGMGIYS